jgi:hypothetical protein
MPMEADLGVPVVRAARFQGAATDHSADVLKATL